ncbi:uncharacterized protein BDZ99DRAFT_463570 [Mytilinidion resinicola]|uniref:Uncharacterized protein n=1 Tax=Mytilinidion resinicola TaxID=574789 RepID=A0A6A6YJD8_9PEZI|nr:uncharacterized protein BDZ99DRAFT_463570 [Mytilinidion resinicola]KAF2808668.1 hypothetical protein BDZ99DRAFT_463570 [Mytilinidion resinicola]
MATATASTYTASTATADASATENEPDITELSNKQYKKYNRLVKKYTMEEKAYKKHITALFSVQTRISESVVVALQHYYVGKPVFKWLAILKAAIAPSDQNSKLQFLVLLAV